MKGCWLFNIVLLLMIPLVTPCWGQDVKQRMEEDDWLKVKVYLSHGTIHAGKSFRIALEVDIKEGVHINSHNPTGEFFIPTVMELREQNGVIYSPVSYPKPVFKSFSFSDKKLSVYEGRILFFAQGRVSENTTPGPVKVSGVLNYQGCTDKACFLPANVQFVAPLKIVEKDEPLQLTDCKVFQKEKE